MCLLEGVGGQLEAATGGSSQLPTCRVRPTAHLVASTIGPAATGPGPIQTQEVASIRLAAMNSFLIGQAAAVTRQSPRSTVMVSSPLQQPNSSMAPDSNHSHVIGRKVIVRIINLVLVEMFKAHLVMIQRKSANPYARETEKGPRPGGAVKAPAYSSSSVHLCLTSAFTVYVQ